MESSHSSSSSSSSSSTPPPCKKPKRTADCIKDIVAALHNALVQSSNSVLLKHLRRLVTLLQSSVASSPALALCTAGFLKLLPPLLSHSCSKVGKKSTEAVGLLAIASYEVSCRLAENQEVLGALGQLLQGAKSDLLNIAIRSILNVATSDVGCNALREVAGLLQQLLCLVSFLAGTLTEKLKAGDTETFGKSHKDLGTGGYSIKEYALSYVNAGVDNHKGDLDFLLSLPLDETVELFDLALAAVNTVFWKFGSVGFIARSGVLISLQSLWQTTIRLQSKFNGVLSDAAAAEFFQSPNRRAQLAKLIMRLVMQASEDVLDKQLRAGRSETCIGHNPLLQTKSDLRDLWLSKSAGEDVSYDSGSSSSFPNALSHVAMKAKAERFVDADTFVAGMLVGNVEHFFQKHWELSPVRMTAVLGLSGFLKRYAGSGPATMVELLVDAMVACPPAVADELDPSVLYKDMEQELGLLPLLNQDIRLLKCKAGVETPYPLETSTVSSRDCIKAYNTGNTVVVRGLQFRWPEIATICNGLAAELGQVTVGANLYLTPPGAQGLGAHFDDHCVFVCQLRGWKRWSVYPPLEPLPRLYSFKTISVEVKKEWATHYDLQAGDLLYIPRGFLHEARTMSLDVEAPAEGSAANNLASCTECYYDESRTSFTDQNDSCSNTSEWHGASLHLSFGVEVEPPFEWEGLLHIALRLWCHKNLQQPGLNNTSPSNLYETLLHVAIRNVGSSSQLFRKACILNNTCTKQAPISDDAERIFRSMLKEVRESADCHREVEWYREKGVAWLDWLRHLPESDCNADLGVCTEVLESAFMTVRDKFCQEASFLESVAAQDVLLRKFRSCRQKVMNGLLALHCGGNCGHQDWNLV